MRSILQLIVEIVMWILNVKFFVLAPVTVKNTKGSTPVKKGPLTLRQSSIDTAHIVDSIVAILDSTSSAPNSTSTTQQQQQPPPSPQQQSIPRT
jgi:hypothetical protein